MIESRNRSNLESPELHYPRQTSELDGLNKAAIGKVVSKIKPHKPLRKAEDQ
jgi:hypothetical protein